MIYLISDLHLEESRPDITEAFYVFLDQIRDNAKTLYILGDFFEAWAGDDENTPLQLSVKKALKEFTASGIETFFMAGNRDFLIGETFSNDTGVTVLDEPSIVEINGDKVLLIHGDSLCTRDVSYMKLRAMIRAPGFVKTFLARPLQDRLTTARQLREMSQASNQDKDNEIMDVTPEEVVKIMEEYKVHTLIHGHTHRPNTHILNVNSAPAKRIVLGDWDSHMWFAKADGQSIELVQQDFPNSPQNG